MGRGATQAASSGGDRPWPTLSKGFERARAREDSLDRLVEWPAERDLLGGVDGLSVLDVGCGNGSKLIELAADGASPAVGVDVSGSFLPSPPGVELVDGDLSRLAEVPGVRGRRFDRVLFLQSFGYAADPVRTLRDARDLLTPDGFVLLTRTQPIHYALQRAAENGTTLGEEYFSTAAFDYHHSGWDASVTLTKRPYTMADLLNAVSEAGLWVERTVEPWLSPTAASLFPEKAARVNREFVGIIMFRLRPQDA